MLIPPETPALEAGIEIVVRGPACIHGCPGAKETGERADGRVSQAPGGETA